MHAFEITGIGGPHHMWMIERPDRASFVGKTTDRLRIVEHLGSAAGAALAGDPLRVRFVLIVR